MTGKELTGKLVEYWQVGAVVLAVAAGIMVFKGKLDAVAQMPAKLDAHTAIGKEQLMVEKTELCLKLAELKHQDWTDCLVETVKGNAGQ